MSIVARQISIAGVLLVLWLPYAALVLIFGQWGLPLPDGTYGEAYGPFMFLKELMFWIGIAGTLAYSCTVIFIWCSGSRTAR